jgi:TPR repeat protein
VDSRLEAAKFALAQEDFMRAFKLLLPCAQEGNSEAQAHIGVLLLLGQGVERNIRDAMKWLRKAANQGRGEAAHNLGTLFLTGEPEVPFNAAESRKWYRRAKELGFVVAPEEFYE